MVAVSVMRLLNRICFYGGIFYGKVAAQKILF